MKLTTAQQAVLDFLREFLAAEDQLPPMHVIAERFDWASNNSAQLVLNALAKKGFIEKNIVGRYRFVRKAVEAGVAT